MTYIKDLFRRYLNNACTEEELSIILRYFELENDTDELEELVHKELLQNGEEETRDTDLSGIVKRNRIALQEKIIKTRPSEKAYRKKKRGKWLSLAASIVLVSFITFYYFNQPYRGDVVILENGDVAPGTNRATLTLENGHSITLSESHNGVATNGEEIRYTDGAAIVKSGMAQYLTLATPRKGQYHAVLPDGSKVWLNAASSIRYPTRFEDSQRMVELIGEAYFEITPMENKPFVVRTKNQSLKVLGTTFNLNAYENESTTATTLVEGSVQLTALDGFASEILKPGQQALLGKAGYNIRYIDVEPYSAWKEGEFRFKATPLPEVLRNLERWYDLDVDYTGVSSDVKIHASIKRDKKLSSVLYALEKISNIKFERKGRRLGLMN